MFNTIYLYNTLFSVGATNTRQGVQMNLMGRIQRNCIHRFNLVWLDDLSQEDIPTYERTARTVS
jgi:hypothetical protein